MCACACAKESIRSVVKVIVIADSHMNAENPVVTGSLRLGASAVRVFPQNRLAGIAFHYRGSDHWVVAWSTSLNRSAVPIWP